MILAKDWGSLDNCTYFRTKRLAFYFKVFFFNCSLKMISRCLHEFILHNLKQFVTSFVS